MGVFETLAEVCPPADLARIRDGMREFLSTAGGGARENRRVLLGIAEKMLPLERRYLPALNVPAIEKLPSEALVLYVRSDTRLHILVPAVLRPRRLFALYQKSEEDTVRPALAPLDSDDGVRVIPVPLRGDDVQRECDRLTERIMRERASSGLVFFPNDGPASVTMALTLCAQRFGAPIIYTEVETYADVERPFSLRIRVLGASSSPSVASGELPPENVPGAYERASRPGRFAYPSESPIIGAQQRGAAGGLEGGLRTMPEPSEPVLTAQHATRESVRERAREMARESMREPGRGAIREPGRGAIRESGRGAPREPGRGAIREAPREVMREADQGAPRFRPQGPAAPPTPEPAPRPILETATAPPEPPPRPPEPPQRPPEPARPVPAAEPRRPVESDGVPAIELASLLIDSFNDRNYAAALRIADHAARHPAVMRCLWVQPDVLVELVRVYADWDRFRHSPATDTPERKLHDRLIAVWQRLGPARNKLMPDADVSRNAAFVRALQTSWKPGGRILGDSGRMVDYLAGGIRRQKRGHFDTAVDCFTRSLELAAVYLLHGPSFKLGDPLKPDWTHLLEVFGNFNELAERVNGALREWDRTQTMQGRDNPLSLPVLMALLEVVGGAVRDGPALAVGARYRELMAGKKEGEEPLGVALARATSAGATSPLDDADCARMEKATREVVSRAVGIDTCRKLLLAATHPELSLPGATKGS